LLSKGIKVRALARPSGTNLEWIGHLPIEIVNGDLLAPNSLESAIRDADYIIHIAGVTKAKRRKDFHLGNVVATRNLLHLASKVTHLKKFCLLSSLTSVGPSLDGIQVDENTPCNPISTYGRSKFDGEQECRAFGTSIPLVILRPPTVYGPRDKDVLELFKTTKLGLQPNIGSTDKTLNLVYGPDLAEAIVDATISEKTVGKTYFVCDPVVYSQTRLFDILAHLVGRKPLRMKLPPFLVYSVAVIVEAVSFFGPKPAVLSIEKARDLLQDHWICSPQQIKQDIGFSTKTAADEGLRMTYQWYKEHGWL
jgi:dihydroflavonol-4-reductase